MNTSYQLALDYLKLPFHEQIQIANELDFPKTRGISNYEFNVNLFKFCAANKKVDKLTELVKKYSN